jgi:hypothetical protein
MNMCRFGLATWLAVGSAWAAEPAAAQPGGQSAALTAEQKAAARTIVTNKCAACHSIGKAMRKDPERMQPHMRQKAKLTDSQIQVVVPYLAAERGNAGKTGGPSASRDSERRKGDRHRRHDDDDEDEHEDRGR